jgi:GNAT superfamily N-acetyltransferase
MQAAAPTGGRDDQPVAGAETAGEVHIELPDGAEVAVRPVRPSDKEVIADGFSRMGERSRYQRFMTVQDALSTGELRYLTDVDHHDHEALLAFEAKTGEGLGVARFVRDQSDPTAAEAAVAVVDAWQRRGLGTALTALLADRAREEGIERFTALLLASNDAMMGMLRRLGPVRVVSREGPVVEAEMDLPPKGIGEQVAGVLRAAARGAEAVTDTHELAD